MRSEETAPVGYTAWEGFRPVTYLLWRVAAVYAVLPCVGSVMIPLADTFDALWSALKGNLSGTQAHQSIPLHVRAAGAVRVKRRGAVWRRCHAGLLRNPLAEGSTLGVSSGVRWARCWPSPWGFSGIPLAIAAMAALFAFLSLMLILSCRWCWINFVHQHADFGYGVSHVCQQYYQYCYRAF